jgi:hypothetical protein
LAIASILGQIKWTNSNLLTNDKIEKERSVWKRG